MINAICGVCDSFLDTNNDKCYELNTWGELVAVDKINDLKNHAAYSVDTMEELKYVRGQIKSLEDLQQELKDLLKE